MTLAPERLAVARTAAQVLAARKQIISGTAWHFIARPKQLPPEGDWFVWLLKAGRGFGKSRSGAEWVDEQARQGKAGDQVLVAGRTPADVRDYSLTGEGGLLTHHRDIEYEPSKRLLTWPNGVLGLIRSGANPEEFRGFSGEKAWLDEFAAWDYPQECWDNLIFGVRERNPQICITTTPRPLPILKTIQSMPSTITVQGTSYENRENLSDKWFENVIGPLAGTRLGRQEIEAEMLEDVVGALWKLAQIDEMRGKAAPDLTRVVVAIDPAVTSTEGSDETGIIVAGTGPCPCKGQEDVHGFVLADLSGRYSPDHWARRAIGALDSYHADRIIAEVNNGGDLVQSVLYTIDRTVPYKAVHASRGKVTRAEPIAALYEQGKMHHVGTFAQLEDQMTTWTPGDKSPDRMDALVWALTELMLGTRTLEWV